MGAGCNPEAAACARGTAPHWNGHWAFGDRTWRIVRGKRRYFLNREPLSTHLRLLDEHGFGVVATLAEEDRTGLARRDMAARFRSFSDDDLRTRTAYILARRR
jgi:hypothetical protein